MPEISLIDRSAKVLARRVPDAFCRLAGIEVAGAALSFEDVSINLPEYRADQVLIIERPGVRWGWHLEYQLRPDRQKLLTWLFKNLALNQQLEIPVVLSVLYLTR